MDKNVKNKPTIKLIDAKKPDMTTDRSLSVSASPLFSSNKDKTDQGQHNEAKDSGKDTAQKSAGGGNTAGSGGSSGSGSSGSGSGSGGGSGSSSGTESTGKQKSKVHLIKVSKPAIKSTAVQHTSKHFDIVLALDIHWTQIPPPPSFNIIPLPLPHPFVGMVFDPMDYISFSISVPSFLQKLGLPKSIPLGGSIYVHGRHKATTTTSVIGVLIPTKHITGLIPVYRIPFWNEAPHDGEVYYGSKTVLAQGGKMSGNKAQQVLTCMGFPIGRTMLPTMPNKPKSFLSFLCFYNNFSSMYIQINTGKPVLVGGPFVPHKYTAGEMLMRFAGLALIKSLGKLAGKLNVQKAMQSVAAGMKKSLKQGAGALARTKIGTKALNNLNNKILQKVLGKNNPLSKKLCAKGFEPINFVTGVMDFEWTDFKILGNTPLQWNNTVYSDRRFDYGMLGNAFNNYDLYIIPDYEAGIAGWMHPGENMAMPIPVGETGEEPIYYRAQKIWSQRPDERTWIITHNHNTYTYTRYTHPEIGEIFKVKEILYADGTILQFEYEGPNYLLRTITDDSGREIELVANMSATRILEVYYCYGKIRDLQVRYNYDDRGNLTHVWDRNDKCLRFYYNDKDLIVKRVNRNGMEYVYEHDKQGRVVYTSGIDGFQEGRLKFYPEEGYTEVIYPRQQNKTERYYYDEDQLIYKQVNGEGGETWYDYTLHNERRLIASPEGRVQGYEYDDQGNITTYYTADGEEYTYLYDLQNRLTARTNPAGSTEQWMYDEQGRLVHYTALDGAATQFLYDDNSRLPDSSTNHQQITTHYTYNAQRQLIQTTNSLGETRIWKYDAYGRPLAYSPRPFAQVVWKRDQMGRVTRLQQPGQAELYIKYDAYDLPVYANNDSQEWFMDYTPMGSLKKQVRQDKTGGAVAQTLHFNYDAYENLTCITNEKKEQYRFVRDKNNAVIEETGFDGQRKTHLRGRDGLVYKTLLPGGKSIHYEYDLAGRLVHTRYSDGSWEAYQYNTLGLLMQAENEHGSVQYARNALGVITQEQQGMHSVRYTYNEQGQLEQLSSSLGAQINHEYDPLGSLLQLSAHNPMQGIEATGAWQAMYSYQEYGLTQQLSGGIQSSFEYDHTGRPVNQKISRHGKTISHRQHSWKNGHQLMQTLNVLTGGYVRYQYDTFGSLASAMYSDDRMVQYKNPDKAGNLYETLTRTDRVYDSGGKLLKDKNWYYHYDEAGNLLLKSKRNINNAKAAPPSAQTQTIGEWDSINLRFVKAESADTSMPLLSAALWQEGDWGYEWYTTGMLKAVRRPDGTTVHMEYDALGRRTAKIYRGRITRYLWDSDVLLHEWSYAVKDRPKLVVDESGSLGYDKEEPVEGLITWVYEQGSFVPAAKLVDGKTYSIVSDYIGRPIHVFDEEGNAVWQTEWDIYGRLRNLKGDKFFIPFRQLGQYEDEELEGLYYNRFRYYDSEIGNYISQDPIGLRGNNPTFYAYVFNSNIEVDVFGLDLTGWIAKTIFEELSQEKNLAARRAFLEAMKKGEVARQEGVSGIKRLTGGSKKKGGVKRAGIEIGGVTYLYELKTIPGSEFGNYRLYGNLEKVRLPGKMEKVQLPGGQSFSRPTEDIEIETVVFRQFKTDHTKLKYN